MSTPLTPKQLAFLRRRRPLLRVFPWMAGILVALTTVTFAALIYSSPLVFNPSYVTARLQANTLCLPTIKLMAGMLPLMSITCLFAVAALIIILISAMGNERNYLRIIEQLQETGDPPS
ncbi:MAG: hypothetical protein ACYDBB_03985 [Armatimonadota bacterium]